MTLTIIYTHDCWNRLVEVEYGSGNTRAEYAYNGLNWRTVKRADTNADNALDQERLMYYSASWQLLEERIDDESPFSGGSDIDRHVQHAWGARYIDDCLLHREDANHDGDYRDTGDGTWYHLTDVQFSTVALINPAATMSERVSYDAYGKARHHWASDVNGNGAVTTGSGGDLQIVTDIANGTNESIGETGTNAYRSEADLNRDGVVNSTDISLVGSAKSALAAGIIGRGTHGRGEEPHQAAGFISPNVRPAAAPRSAPPHRGDESLPS